jgi:hypothetical protein
MVTTSVGMLNGVHGNTSNLGPAVPLHLVFVVGTTSLQDGLVDTASTGNDSDHGSVSRGDDLLGSRGQLDAGPLGVGVVGDDGGVVAGPAGQTTTISGLLLQVGDDGTFGHHTNWHNVSDGEVSLLSAVDELAGVHALGGHEQLLPDLVTVRIAEMDDGERGTTTGIVDDVLNDSLDVTITLGVINGPELGCSLPALGVSRENGSGTLTLGTNDTTHYSDLFLKQKLKKIGELIKFHAV